MTIDVSQKKQIPLLVGIIPAAVILLVSSVLLFFAFTRSATLATELSKSRAENSELRASLQNSEENYGVSRDQSMNFRYYIKYLENELSISADKYYPKNAFISHKFRFQFQQRTPDVPLVCRLDEESVTLNSVTGTDELDVACSWFDGDRFTTESEKEVLTRLTTDLKIITPIKFKIRYISNSNSTLVEPSGITRKGREYVKSTVTEPRKTSYSYTFYAPENTTAQEDSFARWKMQYELQLEVYDETDEAALDEFVEKAIDLVTFLNPPY